MVCVGSSPFLTMTPLSERIRQTRKAAKLSQTELAELAGLSRAIISQLENGKATVRLDVIHKILSALNMELWIKAPHQPEPHRIL